VADVDVIVPVLGRSQNAAPFVESLRASTDRATIWVVVQAEDKETREAWLSADVDELVWATAEQVSFAQKVNLVFAAENWANAPWLFLCGDDVRFHPGWVEAALVMSENADVIGTNDLGPGVDETFSPHLLINRVYVEERGASWDGPGVVCHEGYRHNYVDVEIIAVARQRGVWAMAMDSVVEHLHPFNGKGEDDATYRLGQSFVDADAAVWRERQAEFAQVPA
jgi:glycosyltransferase involved in cell wall biosynthesis